jgi:hypothetical protein
VMKQADGVLEDINILLDIMSCSPLKVNGKFICLGARGSVVVKALC